MDRASLKTRHPIRSLTETLGRDGVGGHRPLDWSGGGGGGADIWGIGLASVGRWFARSEPPNEMQITDTDRQIDTVEATTYFKLT